MTEKQIDFYGDLEYKIINSQAVVCSKGEPPL